MLKWLFAALLVLEAHFAASYLVPLDREAQGEFGGLFTVGVALERWRQWAVGPSHGVFRLPSLRVLPSCERGSAVFPGSSGSGRDLGSVQLVEGAGCGRSYPVALTDGRILRAHKTAADGP